MNTERTPLSVDFSESSSEGLSTQNTNKSSQTRRRSLLLAAVIGSLLVVAGAGYAAFKSAKDGQSDLGAVMAQDMGAAAMDPDTIESNVVDTLVGQDLETEEDLSRLAPVPANTKGWTKVFQCSGRGGSYKQKWFMSSKSLIAQAKTGPYAIMFVNPKNTKEWVKMWKQNNFFWNNMRNGRSLSFNGKSGLSLAFVKGQIKASRPGLVSHFAYSCSNKRHPKLAENIYWACGNGRNGFHVTPVSKTCMWSWSGGNKQAVEMYIKKIGPVAPPQAPVPAPGSLISCGAWKYVIMNGKKRWIPNTQTFLSLFGAGGLKKVKALSKAACAKIRSGRHLTNGARLIQCKGYPHVLLQSNRMKRWICNPATMNMYKFDWKKIQRMSVGQCNKICNGPTLCNVHSYKKSPYLTQLNTKLGVQCPAKMIGQYVCPPGAHETGVDNLGNCICKLCPAGYYCRGGFRSKMKCAAGSYQPRPGQAICIRASPGYYVPKTGSAKQYPCPKGQYQYGRGATACRRSNPGTYIVKVGGVPQHKKCPRGTYQPKAGQTKCVKASAGYFVPRAGWAAQRPCAPGTYQPKTGAWMCVKASKGHFVPGAGSKMQHKCHFGTYQGKVGQRGCMLASPGYFVGHVGSWKQARCPAKTYQHCYGQKQCIKCPAQLHGAKYLPRNAQKQCGFGGKAKAAVNQVKFKPPMVQEDADGLYDGRFDGEEKEKEEETTQQ